MISDANTEINDQPHKMWAEGIEDEPVSIIEINDYLHEKGWWSSNIETWFDTSQGFYRWCADIEELK